MTDDAPQLETGDPRPGRLRAVPPAQDRTPPHDEHAERTVLGAILRDETGRTLDLVATGPTAIAGPDFWNPRHEAIYTAITRLRLRGEPTEPVAVWTELVRAGLTRGLTPTDVITLVADAPLVTQATYYAGLVRDYSRLRRVQRLQQQLGDIVDRADPTTIDGALSAAADLIADTADEVRAATTPLHVRTIDEVLHRDDDEDYDWVVPGLLERHDRLMLTGPEGGGKSTFCRQFAIMAASGMHPFTGELIDRPARVLYLDLENSERQTRRKLRPLRLQAGGLLDPDNLRVEIRPSGIDLLDPDDQRWLAQLVDTAQPDILITGPIYRMASGDPTEEKTAKPVSQALDQVRAKGCAVIIETHTPHATGGQRKRPTRPYGASLWLRWPEFGIHLSAEGDIEHWRGARDERDWPTLLKRGGEWPWTPSTDPNAVRWATIRQARMEFGEPMSVRDLVDATTLSHGTVQRVLQDHRDEWRALNDDPNA